MKLNNTTAIDITRRISGVSPVSPPRWGKLTPAQIQRHLRAHLDVSLERDAVPDESTFMTRTVVKWLTFHVMTRWPKGLPAPAEFFPDPLPEFEAERAALLEALDEFVRQSESAPEKVVLSRGFGPAPLKYWQRMHGLHFQHHLRQLGV